MAIAFIPSDEDTAASYERLNRLLTDLYDVLYHMMVRRSSQTEGAPLQFPQENPRVRPASYSAAPTLPDILHGATPPHRSSQISSSPSSPSCSAHHLSRTFTEVFSNTGSALNLGDQIDDEVFLSGPANIRAAVVHPPKQRRRRKRSNSLKDIKKRNKAKADEAIEAINWRADGQTAIDDDDGYSADKDTTDCLSRAEEKVSQPEGIISSLLSSSFGGSIWTAVVLVVGWKLFVTKR